MKTVFADTFFFIAQFNPHDRAHAMTLAFTDSYQKIKGKIKGVRNL